MSDRGLPWYKRDPIDFLDGVQGLGPEMIGAYAVFIDLIYARGGKTLRDDRHMSGVLGCSIRKARALTEALIETGKLVEDGAFITNSRAKREAKSSRNLSETRAIAGRNGGENGVGASKNRYLAQANEQANRKQIREDKRREEDLGSSAASPSFPREQKMPMQDGKNDLDLRQRVMAACGAPEHPCTAHWMPPAASIHVRRWVTDLGLSDSEVVEVAAAERDRHRDKEPPAGPKALDRAMQALAAAKSAPAQTAERTSHYAERPDEKVSRWNRLAAPGGSGK